jgi:dipeptidyl aminopeptidase/acylaminoacyl peptidase
MLDYAAEDGRIIHAVLSLPAGAPAKNLPLVVLADHLLAGRNVVEFDWLAQALTSRGYAVVQPNARGSDGYGREFVEAAFGQLGRKIQTDISGAIGALAKDGVIDPKRACIVGTEWGGYAALAGVTLQQGLYRCAVSINGIADLSLQLSETAKPTGGGANAATRVTHDLIGADATPASLSPARNAERADAPVLVVFDPDSLQDARAQGETMAAALKKAGKPVEVTQARGGFDTVAGRKVVFEATVAFVMRNNPPDGSVSSAVH